MRIWQWGYPIFTVKIRQSFAFGALWRTSKVSRLCIWCALTCSYCDEPSLSKRQAYWCVSDTRGNQCHLLAWIKTITLQWSCTQYSMNMHLQQSPWAHTHTTRSRSRALMTREGYSRSHESPSYKVRVRRWFCALLSWDLVLAERTYHQVVDTQFCTNNLVLEND